MTGVLYLAWRYLAYNRGKTAILILAITLIVYLPVGLNVLVTRSAEHLTARAAATPLLVGAKGSPLELVLNSLYFDSDPPPAMSYGAATEIFDSGLAVPIPLLVRFRARGSPIVGTTLEYFGFRGLRVAAGRPMALLGECVVGADVARRLDLEPGSSIVSSPESVFDLVGVYPLRMTVTGVLAPVFGADDGAVFVDVKTAWVIAGLVHGHQDLGTPAASSAVLSREGDRITANASVVEYNEITADNVDSFHFHGDRGGYPLTAVIAVPHDSKSGVILQGRYEGTDVTTQIMRPTDVMDELLATVLTVRSFVIAAVIVVGLATLATAALVFLLSIRLRARELLTIFKIGGARMQVVSVLLAEVVGVLVAGTALAALLTALTRRFSAETLQRFFL